MKKIKIGVSGEAGSFSSQAAKEFTRNNGITDYKIYYILTVEKILKQLDSHKIDFGVFSI